MKIKRLVDTWWKIVLIVFGVVVVFPIILGLVLGGLNGGPPAAKATADNAIKACRSSSYAPRDELLGSRSSVKPDGTWTAQEDWPGTFSTDQQVLDDTTYTYSGPRPKPKPWRCTASLAKDGTWTSGGTWTVNWFAGTGTLMGTWYVKNADLRSVPMPRDLSGPGYGG